jgi:two-component system chemotaxis response regulator CheY
MTDDPSAEQASIVRSLILVVDDEPDLRNILRTILERAGHDVADACDWTQALAAVHARRPDLVVTDVRMPVTDGTELVRRLRADPRTAHIPIVATSADRSLAYAADLVLSSTYSRGRLVAAVDLLLGRTSTGG